MPSAARKSTWSAGVADATLYEAAGGMRPAHAIFATSWPTAYVVRSTPTPGARFYLVQDYEPMFYPAGTLYALAEESYRLGLYGLCNTEHMRRLYDEIENPLVRVLARMEDIGVPRALVPTMIREINRIAAEDVDGAEALVDVPEREQGTAPCSGRRSRVFSRDGHAHLEGVVGHRGPAAW